MVLLLDGNYLFEIRTLRNLLVRPPLLEHITRETRASLETILYGNSYRGITDFVTKFVWPKPARHVVTFCAKLGMSPNMVTTIGFILTLGALLGRPDWGYIGVVGWLSISTVILFVRLLQGLFARITRGPLTSWLSEDGVANGPHAKSFKVFSGTWGAYAG